MVGAENGPPRPRGAVSRKSWVYTGDGRCIEKGTPEHEAYLAEQYGESSSVAFVPDEGVFLSPIDGKAYSGRAGMREHNRRHDVVNNRDLAGLPTGLSGKAPPPSTRDRQKMRETIGEIARAKGYLRGQ